MLRVIFSLSILLLLQGCSEHKEVGYFPVGEGLKWRYQITETLAGKASQRELTIENLGPVQLRGEYSDDPVTHRRTSDGTDYYILQDDTGSYRIAKKTLIEYRPRFDPELVRILPNEKDMEIGRSWTVPTKPYALHRKASYAVPDPAARELNMMFEIKAKGQKVEVPFGEFENCVVIEGKALLTLYVDPREGYQEIEITQTEWYAPGVGLVKLKREEPLDTDIYQGGVIIFELSAFND